MANRWILLVQKTLLIMYMYIEEGEEQLKSIKTMYNLKDRRPPNYEYDLQTVLYLFFPND